jgi:hypothetical protein
VTVAVRGKNQLIDKEPTGRMVILLGYQLKGKESTGGMEFRLELLDHGQ